MSAEKQSPLILARYTDPHGRPHRILLHRGLVVDVCRGERPRLVARLAPEESVPQARALLDGSAIDEGYLARARREPRPFIRPLYRRDLEGLGVDQDEADEGNQEAAAREPPLAA